MIERAGKAIQHECRTVSKGDDTQYAFTRTRRLRTSPRIGKHCVTFEA